MHMAPSFRSLLRFHHLCEGFPDLTTFKIVPLSVLAFPVSFSTLQFSPADTLLIYFVYACKSVLGKLAPQ